MGCGCKERCKRWREKLIAYEAQGTRFKWAIKQLRKALLRCPE
jgi:hypothetical protein